MLLHRMCGDFCPDDDSYLEKKWVKISDCLRSFERSMKEYVTLTRSFRAAPVTTVLPGPVELPQLTGSFPRKAVPGSQGG